MTAKEQVVRHHLRAVELVQAHNINRQAHR